MVIHSPDLGADFNREGKRANTPKGMASPMLKPSIPRVGPRMFPCVDTVTSRKPMMGPVQEKDTRTRVNAIRKMERWAVRNDWRMDRLSAFSSIFVDHDEGSVSSNAPKNEAAKTTSNRAKKMLNQALVLSALRALAPNRAVTSSPKAT